ncbi:unnamed protein product [Orchesella dallaii]|uniref:Chitin-binding type-2 domain-containing protein n=1 Tax=Orchesella dallaii TaxID=48710 RepID=A0ABP1PVC1_9HEXA
MGLIRKGTSLLLVGILATITVAFGANKDEDKELFECPEPSGNFADPATCRKFYQCVDGHPYESRCPAGLYFDDINKFCTFKADARCGPIATTPGPVTDPPVDLAVKCESNNCALPHCYCSKDGTIIPGRLDPQKTPQMIIMTFDGAVNINNIDNYDRLFLANRTNPNGCPIRGTFFTTHEYADYQMIQRLHHEGHEIAVETISTAKGLEAESYEKWAQEMIGMKEILGKFANITGEDIIGMRAPYLKPGKNAQYEVLQDFGFVWDSSIGVPPIKIPVWPYTLDYSIPHDCKAGTCPTRSFPGVWELPLNAHFVESFEGGHCPYMDQCVLFNHDPDQVLEWLIEDFKRYYDQNRAPYMMPFHTTWFQQSELEKGLLKFVDWARQQKDVYFVTATQALLWITEPKPVEALATFEGWDCKKRTVPTPPCNLPNKCPLVFRQPNQPSSTRYMTTCFDCPRQFPWTGDFDGDNVEETEIYTKQNRKK